MSFEDYQKIREALALLNSMVASGEDHSDQSHLALAEAFSALDRNVHKKEIT